MFDCGISSYISEISNQLIKEQDNNIVKAVQEMYVKIDKEKLDRCLYDSKSFYDQGFKEGYDKGYEDALFSLLADIKSYYEEQFERSMTGNYEEDKNNG